MRIAMITAGVLALAVSGCQMTKTPAATYTLGNYTAIVNGAPDLVTDAARKTADDIRLDDIASNATKVDGIVTGRDASGQDVTINVEQAGENVSRVTIHIGVAGDESLSKQIYNKIKSHLRWF